MKKIWIFSLKNCIIFKTPFCGPDNDFGTEGVLFLELVNSQSPTQPTSLHTTLLFPTLAHDFSPSLSLLPNPPSLSLSNSFISAFIFTDSYFSPSLVFFIFMYYSDRPVLSQLSLFKIKENSIDSYGRIIQQVKLAELLNRILGFTQGSGSTRLYAAWK